MHDNTNLYLAMSNILKIRNANDYGRYVGLKERHPSVCVVDYSKAESVRSSLNSYDVYAIFVLDHISVELAYGCGKYGLGGGTMVCVGPGQVGGKEDNGRAIEIKGWALLFDQDLLRDANLEKLVRECTFFDYHVNEALDMTASERATLDLLMRQLDNELDNRSDSFSDRLIVGYICLVLTYCKRFYHRQFMTRQTEYTDILARFDSLLHGYFDKELQLKHGLPAVKYFADNMCMSPNYFSDVVRKATGETAGNHIRQYIVRLAKNGLAAGADVTEVAYRLGFDYPQHLSRMFKNITGMTPGEYRGRFRNNDL